MGKDAGFRMRGIISLSSVKRNSAAIGRWPGRPDDSTLLAVNKVVAAERAARMRSNLRG